MAASEPEQPPSTWTPEEYAWAVGLAKAILAAHDKLEPAVEALLSEPGIEAVLVAEVRPLEPPPPAG